MKKVYTWLRDLLSLLGEGTLLLLICMVSIMVSLVSLQFWFKVVGWDSERLGVIIDQGFGDILYVAVACAICTLSAMGLDKLLNRSVTHDD